MMRLVRWPRALGMFSMGLLAVVSLDAPLCASELDEKGQLHSTEPGAVLIGFEDEAQLAELGVTLLGSTQAMMGTPSTVTFIDPNGAAISSAELAAHKAPDVAVEGAEALLLGMGPADMATGVLVPWAKLAAKFSTPKIQVTVWVRSNGANPTLTATYSTAALPASGSFTSVTAIRTGRETSDGWAEVSTGPIDTAVWGVPLAQLTVGLGSSDLRRNANAQLTVDALEIVPVAGTPLPASACTIATQEAACGTDGECQFGHCVPGYASWGPTPSASFRADFVDRWISLAEHVHGARNAEHNAAKMVAARPQLVADTVGGRQFWAGMIGLVNGLRNHHTSFGSPPNVGLLQPLAEAESSSTFGACVGPGELDLLEDPGTHTQLLGFVVYRAAKSPLSGVALQPGDAITQIDGQDPLTWVRSVWLTYASGVPADPGADLAWSATSVAWMISHRASAVEVTRCAAASDCLGANRTVLTIDVAGPAWKNLQGTGLVGDENDPNLLECAVRFQDALTNVPTAGTSDQVATQVQGDVLGVEFDGTLADFTAWENEVQPAFTAAAPTKVLFDVRQGNGGYAENSELIAEEIRDASQPVGEIGFAVASWDDSSTVASLMQSLGDANCSSGSLSEAPCDLVSGDYFIGDYYAQVAPEEQQVDATTPLLPFTPSATAAKVAWLQSADVSANDYLAALVEGRANQRVFAPGPTSGSYGTISSIASMMTGWRGGSIQMTDTVWGTSPSELAQQSFRSGVGVPPDVIAAEKMSDAMAGVDTMIAAAQAWLGEK